MAEFLLDRKLKGQRSSLEVEVSSAGLEATPGMPATSASRRAIERRFGKDFLAPHRATALTPALIAHSDLVLVMTRGQEAFLASEWGGVLEGVDRKVQTLGEFAGRPKVDVDDPVGGDDARYDRCLDLLDELTDGAVKRLADLAAP
jgi:protein-tyrosine-phosphatase